MSALPNHAGCAIAVVADSRKWGQNANGPRLLKQSKAVAITSTAAWDATQARVWTTPFVKHPEGTTQGVCSVTPEERRQYAREWRNARPDYSAQRRDYQREYCREWRKKHPGYFAKYRENQRIKRAANRAKLKTDRIIYAARPDVKAARAAADEARRAKRQADAAARRQKPESKEVKNLRRKELYRSPAGSIHFRMSSAVRRSLKGIGKTSRWMTLVGYTVADLRTHLERQFLPKMGWHNMPKWHVDHIIPLASFEFESENCPAFKAAWSLTNLRPVWAAENLRKHARREFLL